jgi:BTB/POZ domain
LTSLISYYYTLIPVYAEREASKILKDKQKFRALFFHMDALGSAMHTQEKAPLLELAKVINFFREKVLKSHEAHKRVSIATTLSEASITIQTSLDDKSYHFWIGGAFFSLRVASALKQTVQSLGMQCDYFGDPAKHVDIKIDCSLKEEELDQLYEDYQQENASCDYTIFLGESQETPVLLHSRVLFQKGGEAFKRMMSQPEHIESMSIKSVSEETFYKFMDYLYQGKYAVILYDEQEAQELFAFAQTYEVHPLVLLCKSRSDQMAKRSKVD